MSNNAHELSNRLLNALDSNYNVVDMHTVNEIISILEKINITKELLETTRLGKHVNELRRKTTDTTLARRAKVLVKRWRDLVIPTVASPAYTGKISRGVTGSIITRGHPYKLNGSNRSSAERVVRRMGGGTTLTSPALSSLARQVVSPAVPSPRASSRPAWGGYESDSQDVIVLDDDPPSPPRATPATGHAPAPAPATTPAVKRTSSPERLYDEKKAKRDKKPKKKRPGHSRAGSGTETTGGEAPHGVPQVPHGVPGAPRDASHAWGARNGSGRRNGWRRDAPDPYAALVNRLPSAGTKVKTTKELLEQIQSRGAVAASRPTSPRSFASPRSSASPHSPDVMLIEPDPPVVTVTSPLRNGSSESKPIVLDEETPSPSPAAAPAAPPPSPRPPLEDERPWAECTCGDLSADEECPAAVRLALQPLHVRALHHALLPGVNGTRAPLVPHKYAVRKPARSDRPDLFTSVVPLYNYSDYADDYCVKNLSRVPLCTHLPWTEFAPAPPSPPPPPAPPSPRPYPPLDPDPDPDLDLDPGPGPDPIAEPDPSEPEIDVEVKREYEKPIIEPQMVSLPFYEPSECLITPIFFNEDDHLFGKPQTAAQPIKEFVAASPEHRTVERTKAEEKPSAKEESRDCQTGLKEEVDGRALFALCEEALRCAPYRYEQSAPAPVFVPPRLVEGEAAAEQDAAAALHAVLDSAAADGARDPLDRPMRPANFAEWHECALLGDLVALPYVVID